MEGQEEERGENRKEGGRSRSLSAGQALALDHQVGQQASGRRLGLGGTLPEEGQPLESCYCLRSLLRETLSEKSLLVRPGLETSCSQRASEPCEMT